MKKDRNEALMYVLTFNPNGYGHAVMVASYIKDDHTAVIGALHDVVEDGVTTFEKVQEKFDLGYYQVFLVDHPITFCSVHPNVSPSSY